MRLQKVLAHSGYGSRREIDRMIAQGDVLVNGLVAQPGQQIDGTEQVQIQGKKVNYSMPNHHIPRVLMMHKPTGWLCSHVRQGDQPTIYEGLPKLKKGRWISVGRLDLNSSGLLLLTNDGTLAQMLMHPSANLKRIYQVRALGALDEASLASFKSGVEIDGKTARFSHIECLSCKGVNGKYVVSITQGRNRIVRKMFESKGLKVNRLKRIAHGPFELPEGLPAGQFTEISAGIWQLKLSRLLKKKA